VIKMLEALSGVDAETRNRIIWGLEQRLGHPVEETADYEQAFVERELRVLLWIEDVKDASESNGTNCDAHYRTGLEPCPSCNEAGLVFENGCSRCVFCGFGKCDV